MGDELVLSLPYPPSVNTIWRTTRGGLTYMSKRGKDYRKEIVALCADVNPVEGPLRMVVDIYPPDRRKRDIDNICKALLDSLEKAGVYKDDNQICDLRLRRCEVIKGGAVFVSISKHVGK